MSAPLLDIRTSKRTHDDSVDMHVVVVGDRLTRKGRMSKADSELAHEHGIDLHQRLEREDFTGATGSLVSIDIEASPTKLKAFVVVGVGAGKAHDVRIAASVLQSPPSPPERRPNRPFRPECSLPPAIPAAGDWQAGPR